LSSAPQAVGTHLGTVELRIPSKPEWVAVARLTIAAVANRLPFSVEEIEDLKLAIAEACTNVIQSESGADTIEIVCETGSTELKIHVRDHGAIRARQTIAAPQGGASVEGLGVFLIQALMDTVEQTADPDSGNQLVMTKRVGS
jgi:serine/threonine-protein kinase RsbW